MASTPTTKSQVQAYRFVLRRMQSALVRRDAVMLHDPMRNHSRATLVGIVLGAVGMIGFLIWGLFSPDPQLDAETQIAISKETGQIYVVRQSPRVLIPMTNLASARLLLLQESSPDKGQTGSVSGGDAAAGSATAPAAVSGGEPKLVSEKALAKIPKGRLTGIPDGPDMMPAAQEDRIGAEWSVCDQLTLDQAAINPEATAKNKTTVLAGIAGGGKPLDGNKAVLVKAGADAKKAYLIYKRPDDSRFTSTSTVRAEVDLSDQKVVNALRLQGKVPRPISSGLLNTIQEVGKLQAPAIPGLGTQINYINGGVVVGDVLQATRTGEKTVYYVALDKGLQEVPTAVGDIIRFAYKGDVKPKEIDLSTVGTVVSQLDLGDFPTEVPAVLDANADNSVMCLSWRADNVGAENRSEHTEVTVAAVLPGAKDAVPVQINQAGATGEVVSQFIMAAGKAGVVRSSTSIQDYGSGPIHLITGRGVKYGIPDTLTSGALGLGKDGFMPAPESIVSLLPNGPQLNRNDASRSYDSIPSAPGVLPEDAAAKKAAGG
ncbi:type VII secretion protein EccB [Umezawaea sp. Da 62-37]|uniref:type VII secretion protein EccB n=1 Tax=Umezawaea sp. Da 62-37 TaxID=3075927 RepID=UPI0028F6E8C8|nr:type VII secretion protein EccB [Umezawaea sp. Da 62-37]WNV90861.1 type VII secretion protein EccB [Umezawaea sp. Da 62-37]